VGKKKFIIIDEKEESLGLGKKEKVEKVEKKEGNPTEDFVF